MEKGIISEFIVRREVGSFSNNKLMGIWNRWIKENKYNHI
jgi:hypothetical protein